MVTNEINGLVSKAQARLRMVHRIRTFPDPSAFRPRSKSLRYTAGPKASSELIAHGPERNPTRTQPDHSLLQ